MEMRSFKVVLTVTTSWPLTVNILPGRAGSLGLMVATSKAGLASAAIRTGGGGASGIAHAVAGGAHQIQGHRPPLGPGPQNRVPVPTHLPLIATQPADRNLYRRTVFRNGTGGHARRWLVG